MSSPLPAPWCAQTAEVAQISQISQIDPIAPIDHLLIAYAATQAPSCQQALSGLSLPHLEALLEQLTPVADTKVDMQTGSNSDGESSYAPPHERAWAQVLGLPCVATPWAAWYSQNHSQGPSPTPPPLACAYITPCHWQAGADQILMHPPQVLGLQESESRQFLALIAPWLEEDGITLSYLNPLCWLAQGQVFEGLHCASLDRVQGRDVRHWMPQGTPQQQRLWQRLHSEMQMLLYDQPLNDARTARGLPAVNAFWVHGAGAWTASALGNTANIANIANTANTANTAFLCWDLRASALREDGAAWADAWRRLDAGLLAQLAQHPPLRLTLCGEQHARTWRLAPRSLGQRVRQQVQRVFRPQRWADIGARL